MRQAADSQTASKHALSALTELCQIYWRPVYVFLRRQGIAQHDAQDLTQAFFTDLIENRAYTRADPVKGNRNDFLKLAARGPHFGLIILIRRRSPQAECTNVLRLIRKAGEQGLRGNINFA